jgi:transposase InsO family protein
MNERRACRVIDADRKSVRYRSARDDDGGLREKLRELANRRRRFGYRRLHILLRREGVTRECLGAVPDTLISVHRVVRGLIAKRGKSGIIVSDIGTELTSNAFLTWCGQIGVEWHYTAPGKPMQNELVPPSLTVWRLS